MITRFSTFTEGDIRIFIPSTMSRAIDSVRNGTADGMTVDVIDDSGNYRTSYEIVPGRSLVVWHDEECF